MGLMSPFFKQNEDGFTTAGAAVALLLALVLAFGAVQTIWVQSRAGQVQYVADVAALAADGAVGELVFYAEVIDAALLSMALLGVGSYAASGVAAFIPGGEGVALKLAEVGSKVFKARDDFARSAQKGLNMVQKVLPALCTFRAMEVIDANSNASGISYAGVAIPVPFKADEITVPDIAGAEQAAKRIEEEEEDVEKEAKRQEDAQEKIDKAKEAAWRADCGGNPSMRERASALASLLAKDNPNYASAETWSFSVGLARAKSYYTARLGQEEGENYSGSPEEVGKSVARKAYYKYALEQVSQSNVSVDKLGTERLKIRKLARNTDQVKDTVLYTQAVYPVSAKGSTKTLHAYSRCPGASSGSNAGYAAVSAIESGSVSKCEICKYSVTTLGRVPSASTSISNGFEYSYRLFAEAADDYDAAAKELLESGKKLEESADKMSSAFDEALKSLKKTRIEISPPGRYGCICIVAASRSMSGVGAGFTGTDAVVGTRVAISAATLAVDKDVDQSQVLQNVGAGLVTQESLTGTIAKTVFGLWGTSLAVYADGVDGLKQFVESALNAVPLVGTELSNAVSEKFMNAVEEAGLEPAHIEANKPVLVSSSLVLKNDSSRLAQSLLLAQQGAAVLSKGSEIQLGDVVDFIDQIDTDGLEVSENGKLVLATISFAAAGLGLGKKEITMDAAQDLLQRYSAVLSKLRSSL